MCQIDHKIEQKCGNAETCQTHSIERQEALRCFVFDPKVELPVEDKRGKDTDMNTDYICPEVGHNIEMAQQGVDTQIECRAESADDTVQYQIAETCIELFGESNDVHIVVRIQTQSKRRLLWFAYIWILKDLTGLPIAPNIPTEKARAFARAFWLFPWRNLHLLESVQFS